VSHLGSPSVLPFFASFFPFPIHRKSPFVPLSSSVCFHFLRSGPVILPPPNRYSRSGLRPHLYTLNLSRTFPPFYRRFSRRVSLPSSFLAPRKPARRRVAFWSGFAFFLLFLRQFFSSRGSLTVVSLLQQFVTSLPNNKCCCFFLPLASCLAYSPRCLFPHFPHPLGVRMSFSPGSSFWFLRRFYAPRPTPPRVRHDHMVPRSRPPCFSLPLHAFCRGCAFGGFSFSSPRMFPILPRRNSRFLTTFSHHPHIFGRMCSRCFAAVNPLSQLSGSSSWRPLPYISPLLLC